VNQLFFEAVPSARPAIEDVKEVANYVSALKHRLARLKELPVSLRLMREMHERLMYGIRGDSMTPGKFRRSQNRIGQPGCTLADAIFVPPPVAEMTQALNDFEKYLHAHTIGDSKGSNRAPPQSNLCCRRNCGYHRSAGDAVMDQRDGSKLQRRVAPPS
jgi:hypothetical protein